MNKLGRNFIYTSGYQLLCVIIPLVTTPFLTRVLGKTNLGIDGYVLSIVQICEIAGSLGTSIYGNREIAYVRDDREKLVRTFWEILSLRLLLCLMTCGVYLFIALHSKYRLFFLIQLLTVVGYFIDTSWYFIGTENVKPVTICNAVIRISTTACIFAFVRSRDDLVLYVKLYAIGQILVFLLLLSLSVRANLFRRRIRISIARHLRPVAALFLPQAASSIYVLFDKTMIGLLASDISRISLYDKAEVIVKAPTVIAVALTQVLMPRMANEYSAGRMEHVKKLVRYAFDVSLLLFLPVSAGLAVIAPIFVPRYLGPEYYDSIRVVWVLAPIIVAIALSNVSGAQFLIACNQTKALGISYVVSAVFNITGNYFLIPHLNEIGASITTTLAESIVVCIQFIAMHRVLGRLGFWEILKKKLLAVCLMSAVIVPLHVLGDHIYVGLLQIVIGAAVYFSALGLAKDDGFMTLLQQISAVGKKRREE